MVNDIVKMGARQDVSQLLIGCDRLPCDVTTQEGICSAIASVQVVVIARFDDYQVTRYDVALSWK
jgi:hypothetical protein